MLWERDSWRRFTKTRWRTNFGRRGLCAEQQQPIQVVYDGTVVGDYLADIVVEDLVIVELKAVKAFDEVHFAQCINYLNATGMKICLLINFGQSRIEIKRFAN